MNLTTLWKAAGGDERNKPVKWLTNEGAKDFISSLAKEFKSQESDLLKITKGRYGGTFGHWQIALAYAKYLSPEFHIAANKIIKRYIEEEIGDVDRIVLTEKSETLYDILKKPLPPRWGPSLPYSEPGVDDR